MKPDPSCLRFQSTSLVRLCIVTPFVADTQRTGKEAVKGGASSAPEETIKLVDMAGRYSFSDGESPTRNGRSATLILNVSFFNELRQHHHVLELTPPVPIQPSVSAMPSVTASGSMMTMPATTTKGGTTLLSQIGSVKRWGVRKWRGTSSTPSEVIGGLFFYFILIQLTF